MALWLKFQFKGKDISPSEQFIKKIYFKESIEDFIGIKEKKYELWDKEIFEELGGVKIQSLINLEKLIEIIKKYDNGTFLILKTKGYFKFNKNKYFVQTVLFNPKKYRKVYGDMELDFTNTSFEEFIINNHNFNDNISEFLTRDNPFVTLYAFVVSDTPDSIQDIRLRIRSYHRSIKFLVDDFFSTLKIWSEEERYKPEPFALSKIDYEKYFTQFNTQHLSKLIEKETKFLEYCKKLSKKSDGLNLIPGSIFLEADNKKYFEELFNSIKNDFDKIKDQWFSEKKLKHALRKWFEGQQNLDDYNKK